MSRRFGAIRQNGYVVRDIEAALHHWTEVLGVGPFFYIERVPIEDFRYRGEPSALEASIALANWGDLQIELIQQRNDAPSMYRDFLASGQEGLQHVACWYDTLDAPLAEAARLGLAVGQSGGIGEGGRFAYLETETHGGTVVEISEINGSKGRFFEHVREAAASWDGSKPIRPLGANR
ncbi:MAG: VOC family protein [Deltaproteobacteria bacterium]|nr:VOC family protein [Deltaproteobacteria bacterium]MBW2448233.1 VOC family protein [Deltaproteobacteria bacterium]